MAARFSPDQLRRALDLQTKGFTQAQIAQQLAVHHKTVARHLGAYNRRLLRHLERTKAAITARHLTQLEWIASEALRQWERSQLPHEVVKTTDTTARRAGDDTHTAPTKVQRTLAPPAANVAYLAEARAALAEVRKILRIAEHGDEVITPEDVRRLIDVLAKAVGAEKHPALLAAMERIVGPN